MAMSIESALQLEVFNRVSATVYAGQSNFDRCVRWVHPTEIPDIAKFLSGGEMLLTAGLGIGDTAKQQRQYIYDVDDAHAVQIRRPRPLSARGGWARRPASRVRVRFRRGM